MLAVSVNSTHCFSAAVAAVRVAAAAAAAAVAAVFESCPRERGRESARAPRPLERALAARGADDRSAADDDDGQVGGRVLSLRWAGGPGRPKQAQVAHEQERGAGEDGEGETTVLPKNERPPRRGAVPRFFRREIPAVVSLALHSKEQQRKDWESCWEKCTVTS